MLCAASSFLHFTQFLSVEGHVNGLLDKVPRFVESCRDFQTKAEDISQRSVPCYLL